MHEKLGAKDSSTVGDSSKGSKEGSSQGELLHLEALHGATKQNLDMQRAGEHPMTWRSTCPLAV
jgi:hypothetical protein